jgi:hypothetical protein
MRSSLIRAAVLVLLSAVGFAWVVPFKSIGDDVCHVLVTVRTPPGLPVTAVYAEAFSKEPLALHDLDHLPGPDLHPDHPTRWAVDRPFTGQTLTLAVWVSEHVTYWGLVRDRYYPRQVLVIVEYRDGRRATKVMDLPSLWGLRSTQVIATVGPP